MLNIFIIMCLGVAMGWLTRRSRHPRRVATVATTAAILTLMLLLGTEVGGNEMVLNNLGSIGLTALLLGLGAVAGVLISARVLWCYSFQKVAPMPPVTEIITTQEVAKSAGNRFSLLIVSIFTLGIAIGILTPASQWVGSYSLTIWALYSLMIAVGITIGSDTATLRNIARQPKRSVLVPLTTIIGTWIGVTIVWGGIRLFGGMPILWSDAMAVGSGLGYYSLSGVLLGELRGAELGTIALLANIFRELVTLVAMGWMVRRFSPLAPICSGGVTTEDVTLPGIIQHCGIQYAPLAIFHGVIVDLSVPFMVSFFAGMAY